MGNNFSEYQQIETYTDRLKYSSETYPNKEVLIFYSEYERCAYTPQQLYTLGGRFAFKLRALGLKKHDVVANTLPNSPERVVTDIGIWLAGCVSLSAQIVLADGEDFYAVATKSRCSAVIMGNNGDFQAWKVLKPYLSKKTSEFFCDVSCEKAPDLKKAVLVTRDKTIVPPLIDILQSSTDVPVFHEPMKGDDIVAVNLTSGSTGFSKLVPRTNKEYLQGYESYVQRIADEFPLEKYTDQPFYSDRPLGWILGVPLTLVANAFPRVLTDLWPSANYENTGELMWHKMKAENCFCALILSLDANSILNYLDSLGVQEAEDFRLKFLITTGQPYRKVQTRKLFRITENVVLGYGSTEQLFVTFGFYGKEQADQLYDYMCGPALKDCEIRVVNEDHELCKPKEIGLLEVRGPGIFRGYFNRLNATDPDTLEAFTTDGYFQTGDLCYLDNEGNVYVQGRDKDIIMYGPNLVYPCWMEERILRHPDVVEACVIPVPDPVLYHEICACVKIREGQNITEKDLEDFCTKTFMSDIKGTPKPKFYLILGSDFPETSSGKPNKQKLKIMAASRFGVYE